jgi:pyridoxamine 5'-phosphate oxidase
VVNLHVISHACIVPWATSARIGDYRGDVTDAADAADHLAAMRREYEGAGLDEREAGDDPLALLRRWLDEVVAAGVHEPNAIALATATPDGAPSVRIVLAKGLDERGLSFFTHYTSRKGAELEANPRAASTFLWHPVQRQVRLEGRVERLPGDESDAYFASRPRGARLGAVASHQSRPVADRVALEQQLEAVSEQAGNDEVRRPETWGGYLLVPQTIEFWHGRPNRLHDRLLYRRAGDRWDRERLQP